MRLHRMPPLSVGWPNSNYSGLDARFPPQLKEEHDGKL